MPNKRICKKAIVVLVLTYLGISNMLFAQSTIVSITHDDVNTLNRYLSPVVNGSFETGGPNDGVLPDKTYFWTRSGNTHVPSGWSSAGDALSYGTWGSRQTADDAQYGPGTSVVNTIFGSTGGGDFMFAPGYGNGNNLLYFGDYELCAGAPAPAYNAITGEYVPAASVPAASSIIWVAGALAGTPYTISAPVALSQTITGLVPNASYDMEFWVTGEAGSGNAFEADGIFELKIDNNRRWLTCPGTGNIHGLGTSERYHIRFSTGATQTTVTISFINYGHFHQANNPAMPDAWFTGGNATGNKKATELALDDVIINPVGGSISQADASTLMASIYKSYDSLNYLSFNIKYTYTSDTVNGDFTHDVLEGAYTLAGKKAKFNLGDIEFMQNDSFFITVYNDDKYILVADPHNQNTGGDLPMRQTIDSLISAAQQHYNYTYSFASSPDSSLVLGQLSFDKTDNLAQFEKFRITYDTAQKVLQSIDYVFLEPSAPLDTLINAPLPAPRVKRLKIEFSKYRFDNFSENIYDENQYIFFEDNECKPVSKYKDYKIFYSRIGVTNTVEPPNPQ